MVLKCSRPPTKRLAACPTYSSKIYFPRELQGLPTVKKQNKKFDFLILEPSGNVTFCLQAPPELCLCQKRKTLDHVAHQFLVLACILVQLTIDFFPYLGTDKMFNQRKSMDQGRKFMDQDEKDSWTNMKNSWTKRGNRWTKRGNRWTKCENSGNKCENSGNKCENSGNKCENSGNKCENSGNKCENSGNKCEIHGTSVKIHGPR